jgi:hypothetical protein
MSYVPQNLLQANPPGDSPGEAPQGSPSKSSSYTTSEYVSLLISQKVTIGQRLKICFIVHVLVSVIRGQGEEGSEITI